ncbi:hypothetical protein K9N68_05930 [Kovacikia minuta CCNUW1]|uniref:hypothetical protein n=1 Tax=Kovacikia minuta TaxID=2931930 RepID=UPI001CCB19C2|nr:hypothetical protein [Kovacikia minuta]UBF27483.1 hypothetical protein K9N68_05930 [Kovacikia minuta CCNUW1]
MIGEKKKYLESLVQKYKALYTQLSGTLNEVDKVPIRDSIRNLEVEIQEIEAEIKQFQFSGSSDADSYRAYSTEWEEKLPKINFIKANKIITSILNKFENKEGAALFLMQNSRSMGAKWCAKNIKSQLQDLGKMYPPCEFEFLSHQQTRPQFFLNFLAEKFQVQQAPGDSQTYLDMIVDRICGSLRRGNIFYIQIEIYSLHAQDDFLNWFVNQFWCPLVRRLSGLCHEHPLIRLIAVLMVRDSLPKDSLPNSLCCRKQTFHGEKILELPLQNWTEPEIHNWLVKFSGLNIQVADMKQMAQSIHRVAKGRPNDVHSELMNEMSKLVS